MSEHSGKSAARPTVWITAMMIAVLLLGTWLLWHDLGTREVLGKDENATIIKLDQPGLAAALHASGLKANGQPSSMQPLYFIVQHLVWPVVDHSAFLLRFLPSVFALLSIVFTFKLGQALWGDETGLVGALLLAALPLNVEYGQIIRPYTLFCLLSLASAYFLVQGLRTGRLGHWAGFVLLSVLNVYTHFNASLVLVAEGLFVAVVWLVAVASLLKGRGKGNRPSKEAWFPRLALPVFAFALVGIFCIPAILRLVELQWLGSESSQVAGEIRVQLNAAFFYRYLYKIGLTSAWSRWLILGLAALGLIVTLFRRRWQTALFAVLWLSIPFLILARLPSPRPFAERYVIFVTPVALLLVGQGVTLLGEGLASLGRLWNSTWIRRSVIVAMAVGLALLFLAPLRAYHADNRASQRLNLTVDVVERLARPGDVIVVSPRFFVDPLEVNGAEVLYLRDHPSAAEMDELAEQYPRMWILYTSFIPPAEMQEPLDQWVQSRGDQFALVRIKASTTLAYRNEALTDPAAHLLDRAGVLQEMAQVSADEKEAWLRYNMLADTYQALSDYYEGENKPELAAEYRQQAERARKAGDGQ